MNLNRVDLPKHLAVMDNTIDSKNKKQMEEDGAIFLDTDRAKELGFTTDLFQGYLWEDDGNIWISFIYSINPCQGNCTRLIQKLLEEYKGVIIPSPSEAMCSLCRRFIEEGGTGSGILVEDSCKLILLNKKGYCN